MSDGLDPEALSGVDAMNDVVQVMMERVKKRRADRGVTQSEMAEELGITAKHYMRYENGKSVPKLSQFVRILELLGLCHNDILYHFGAMITTDRED